MNTSDLVVVGADEDRIRALVVAFVKRERRLPRGEDLKAMRDILASAPGADQRLGPFGRAG